MDIKPPALSRHKLGIVVAVPLIFVIALVGGYFSDKARDPGDYKQTESDDKGIIVFEPSPFSTMPPSFDSVPEESSGNLESNHSDLVDLASDSTAVSKNPQDKFDAVPALMKGKEIPDSGRQIQSRASVLVNSEVLPVLSPEKGSRSDVRSGELTIPHSSAAADVEPLTSLDRGPKKSDNQSAPQIQVAKKSVEEPAPSLRGEDSTRDVQALHQETSQGVPLLQSIPEPKIVGNSIQVVSPKDPMAGIVGHTRQLIGEQELVSISAPPSGANPVKAEVTKAKAEEFARNLTDSWRTAGKIGERQRFRLPSSKETSQKGIWRVEDESGNEPVRRQFGLVLEDLDSVPQFGHFPQEDQVHRTKEGIPLKEVEPGVSPLINGRPVKPKWERPESWRKK